MVGQGRRTVSSLPDPGPEKPQIGAGTLSLAQKLEVLRSVLHQRLDALESLVRAGDDATVDAGEQALREQIENQEQSKRQYLEDLEQLETERAQLAEAWERLEQERTRTVSHPTSASGPARSGVGPARRSGSITREMENPVSRALLHQFQEVQGDVKRHAEEREDHSVD